MFDELHRLEIELLDAVYTLYHNPQAEGHDEALEKMQRAYQAIHTAYADMAAENLEALKRGLFIQWYMVTEPSYLSGIQAVDPQSELKIIAALDHALGNHPVDEELHRMMAHYASWGHVFERFSGYPNLHRMLADKPANLPSSFLKNVEGRGQMGDYWKSIAAVR